MILMSFRSKFIEVHVCQELLW